MKLCGLLLIVAEFIQWAKPKAFRSDRAVLGRGLAGRLGADHYRSRPDPVRPAVRAVLNPERVSMPDFDIDFCQDRRGE